MRKPQPVTAFLHPRTIRPNACTSSCASGASTPPSCSSSTSEKAARLGYRTLIFEYTHSPMASQSALDTAPDGHRSSHMVVKTVCSAGPHGNGLGESLTPARSCATPSKIKTPIPPSIQRPQCRFLGGVGPQCPFLRGVVGGNVFVTGGGGGISGMLGDSAPGRRPCRRLDRFAARHSPDGWRYLLHGPYPSASRAINLTRLAFESPRSADRRVLRRAENADVRRAADRS